MRDMAASILTRLKKQAQETGLNYQMCLQLFCQEEFLRRLSLSPYCSNFVLKGGLLIYTLTNFQSRATQDIDFLMRKMINEIEKVKNIMEEIVRVSTENDYVSFEVLDATIITQEKEYSGVSVKFIGRIKQVRIPFSIDLGVDGSGNPNVRDFGKGSKDYVEIESFLMIRLEHLTTKIAHERINNFYNNAFLLSRWKRFQPSMQMELLDFTVVLNRLQKFLEPVFDSSIRDKIFFMKWSVDEEL